MKINLGREKIMRLKWQKERNLSLKLSDDIDQTAKSQNWWEFESKLSQLLRQSLERKLMTKNGTIIRKRKSFENLGANLSWTKVFLKKFF